MQALAHPSFRQAIAHSDVAEERWTLGVPLPEEPGAQRGERGDLFLVAGEALASWKVPSLSFLFRGNAVPPNMTEYPPDYVPAFFLIERQVLLFSRIGRVPTDGELAEAFANLRRRPDGRSLGAVHDALWQVSALTLGRFALSEAEFGAIVGRLSRSAGHWKRGLASREYTAYLQRTFG